MDPGLQPQRTALAWQRTCLAAYLGAIALGFAAIRHDAPLISAAALLAGMVVTFIGVRWIPRGAERPPGAHGSRWLLGVVVAIVSMLAFLGIVLSVESLLRAAQ